MEGSISKVLYRDTLNRPRDLSLTTEDIEGAKPRSRAFRTGRCTNPLNPQYRLPSVPAQVLSERTERIGVIPTNFISDIEKSCPRHLFVPINGARSSLDTSDIPFTEPNHFRRKIRPMKSTTFTRDPLNVTDINSPSVNLRWRRHVDPLNPVYQVSERVTSCENLDGIGTRPTTLTIGPIEGSKPKSRIGISRPAQPVIEFSSPQRFVGTLPYSVFDNRIREVTLPTGSRSNTLKRGIVSKRQTDPTFPKYKLLDGAMDRSCEILTESIT